MVQYQFTTIEKNIQQVADMILLNGTLTECPGLVYGKTGIAIFFFHYAQYTGNMLFADYAMDLILEMQDQIHANSSANYEKGIAGISVGIDYLIRNNFLITEDDICEDFDERMHRAVMHDPWQGFSLYDGLIGYGRYWISRLRQQPLSVQAQECLMCIAERIEENLPDISEEEQTDVYCFLCDLHEISGFDRCSRLWEQCQKWNLSSVNINRRFPRFGNSVIGNSMRIYHCNHYFNDTLQGEIDIPLKQIPDLDMNKPPVAMGLLTGYAGEGLLRLAALDATNISWMQLL